MGRHRGWTVSAPGTATVTYPTRGQAESVASNVVGAKVSGGSGCPLTLLMLPLWPLLVAVHLIRTSAAAAPCGMGGPRAAEGPARAPGARGGLGPAPATEHRGPAVPRWMGALTRRPDGPVRSLPPHPDPDRSVPSRVQQRTAATST
jgi:hypothetical protein